MMVSRGLLAGLLVMVAASMVAGPIMMDAGGERPPVVFDHDLHTEAVTADGAPDCSACHVRDDAGALVLMVDIPESRTAAREAAHRRCGDCHLARQSGPHPALCAACHVARRPEPAPDATTAMDGFDHDDHTDALDDDCARCHHVADPTTGHLVAADGDEAACVDCHDGLDGRPAMQQAAHGSCVVCHESEGGPVTCAGCHGLAAPVER